MVKTPPKPPNKMDKILKEQIIRVLYWNFFNKLPLDIVPYGNLMDIKSHNFVRRMMSRTTVIVNAGREDIKKFVKEYSEKK